MDMHTEQRSLETRQQIAQGAAAQLIAHGVFASVRVTEREGQPLVVCGAKDAPVPIEYRAHLTPDACVIEFATQDRWVSQSIEADLMSTGDALEELLEEELVDHGCDIAPSTIEHFRSDDMDYVFRVVLTQLPADEGLVTTAVVAYLESFDACFCELGDVRESGEE